MRCFDIVFEGSRYVFSPWLGWLFKRQPKPIEAIVDLTEFSDLERRAWQGVQEPFTLEPRELSPRKAMPRWHRAYIALLIWAARYCFPLIRLCLLLRLNTYDNAGQASEAFYRNKPIGELQKQLCLSRAVYVATTSRRFRKEGKLFIGVFLPLVRMHAWVIEDNMHADIYDRVWVDYRPVAMY